MFFRLVTSETKESFILRTNALLVGTLISIGDVSVTLTMGTTKIVQSNQMSTSVTRET